jgi:hypothetical protein
MTRFMTSKTIVAGLLSLISRVGRNGADRKIATKGTKNLKSFGSCEISEQNINNINNHLLAPKGQKKVASGREPKARYPWLEAKNILTPEGVKQLLKVAPLTGRVRFIRLNQGLRVALLRLPLATFFCPFGARSSLAGFLDYSLLRFRREEFFCSLISHEPNFFLWVRATNLTKDIKYYL